MKLSGSSYATWLHTVHRQHDSIPWATVRLATPPGVSWQHIVSATLAHILHIPRTWYSATVICICMCVSKETLLYYVLLQITSSLRGISTNVESCYGVCAMTTESNSQFIQNQTFFLFLDVDGRTSLLAAPVLRPCILDPSSPKRPHYVMYIVRWDIKLHSLTHSLTHSH